MDVTGPAPGPASAVIGERVAREGSIRFDEYVDLALYAEGVGFYAAAGGGAGRRRDFLTSPEVGPLFGAVVARYLDTIWAELGRPDPFLVVEAGAGPGSLCRSVLAAGPECAPALRYVLVDRGAGQREAQQSGLPMVEPFEVLGPDADEDEPPTTPSGVGPLVCRLADLPATPIRGVVLANELLDNLPFRVVERGEDGWLEVRVGPAGEVLGPADEALANRLATLVPDAVPGARVPVQEQATEWVRRALAAVEDGRVLLIDYASTSEAMASRPPSEWLRTYREQQRGGPALDAPGTQDITVEVALDQLPSGARVGNQAEWLASNGLEALVEEGRRVWAERAHLGDLAAMRARSRMTEAEALTDPGGLGAFAVVEYRRGDRG